MVSVTIKKANGKYKHLSSIGHAGYGKSGQDIVCAAVSVLIINALNSIEELVEDKITEHSEQQKGLIDVEFAELSEKSVLLLDSMVLGLEEIEKQYGRKYLTVTYEEASQ